MSWFFYDYIHSIDDELYSLPETAFLDIPQSGQYAVPCFHRVLTPRDLWKPFNPSDNHRLHTEDQTVSVGNKRLLYEVTNQSVLKPIYWKIPISIPVTKATWVFQHTHTPVEPRWDEELSRFVEKWDPESYRLCLEEIVAQRKETDIALEISFESTAMYAVLSLGSEKMVYLVKDFSRNSVAIARSLLNNTKPRNAMTLVEFSWETYKAEKKLPDRPSDSIDYELPSVDNLILVVHGVGQHLESRKDSLRFTQSVDKLWVRMKQALDKEFAQQANLEKRNFLVLPVNWRRSVQLNNTRFGIEDIKPPSLKYLRDNALDVFLDILFYMSDYQQNLLMAACAELNSLFHMVQSRHPDFSKNNSSVNIVGHSLGSLIMADLLTSQSPSNESNKLDFEVNNFFTIGSPLGLFMVLRDEEIQPRLYSQEGCLAVNNLYNIAHESDLLACLLNQTVQKGAFGLKTATLPQFDKPKQKGVRDRLVSVLTRGYRPSTYFPASPEMLALNDNGQVDWVIKSKSSFSQIFDIFTSHFGYWSNEDFAMFLTLECARKQGREHTLMQLRPKLKRNIS